MAEKTIQENKMGVMQEGKLLINMSLPMMISMLVQSLYNIVDSIFVSRISENALTAVSLAFPLQMLMIALGAGTGVGVNALVSRALGAKEREKASKVAMNGVFVYALSYLFILILGLTAVKPFFRLQTNADQAEIYAYGVKYLTIVMIFSFGIFGQFVFERLLQATGRTLFTMFSQSIGAIINLIFDPIMIFGLLGFPKLGIAGAAIATVLGQIVAALIAFWGNMTRNKDIHLSLKGFRPDGKIIGEIYKIGVPSICMQAVGSVMNTCMNLILMNLSSTAAAVFGVYYKLQSFFFMPLIGMNNGMVPIIGYNLGARKRDRIKNTMRYSYIIGFGLMFLGFLAFELIPRFLLGFFDASDVMLEIGVPALRTIGLHFLAAWFCITTGSLFQATGKATFSLIVSLARQGLALLPAAYIFARIGGATMIWWCFPVAEVISLIFSLFFKKKVNREILEKLE